MAKGGDFEWVIARRLSLWLTKGVDKTQLIRSVQSGGWAGKASPPTTFARPEYQVGDVAPNGPAGEAFRRKYAVECKASGFYPDWWGAFGGKKEFQSSVEAWWRKLDDECIPYKLLGLLIMKKDRCPIVVGVHSTMDISPLICNFQRIVIPHMHMTVITLDDLCASDPDPWMAGRS